MIGKPVHRCLTCSLWVILLLAVTGCSSNEKTSARTSSSQQPAPGISELTIESDGARMSGLIYTAAGKGPHPTVVLLHGYPGNEKNLDLAQALRRDGWNVLFFHYRGAWGSEGEFSFSGAEQDVQSVIQFLQQAKHSKRLRVDPDRISTVGHSMGGHMAVAGLLDNPTVNCAVALDGANMGAQGGLGLFKDPRIGKVWRDYSDTLFMLEGWSGQKAMAEMEQNGTQLDLLPRAHSVGARPVLLLAADTEVISMDTHIAPLYEALSASAEGENNQIELTIIPDDHSFSASRLEMIKEVSRFLNQRCR